MFKFTNISKKTKKKIPSYVRAVIQLIFFLFMPSAYTAAFAGVKYIFTQIGTGQAVELTSFVSVLIVLCLYTFVFGRFFCGFACAFGSFGDAFRAAYVWICKKRKKKPITLNAKLRYYLSYIKYIILAGIVVMCFMGVYGNLKGTSPWDVFSMIRAGNFGLSSYVVGIILLLIIIVGMCLQERFFCRFLCPMGAIFSILPVLPFFSLVRDRENCIKGCSACTRQCPSDIGLPDSASKEGIVSSDCFQCQKCIGTCPKGNVHCGIGKIKGNEIVFTLIRAIILLVLFILLGI